jgi:hypothetical protein
VSRFLFSSSSYLVTGCADHDPVEERVDALGKQPFYWAMAGKACQALFQVRLMLRLPDLKRLYLAPVVP